MTLFKPLRFGVICYIAIDNTTNIDQRGEVNAEVEANGSSFLLASIFSVKKGARSSAGSEGAARGNRCLRRDKKV